MSSEPTTAEVATVKANLANMQHLNDWLHNDAQDKIQNAFLLFDEGDLSPSNKVVLDILGLGFAAIGAIPGIGTVVTVAGKIMYTVTNDLLSNPPESINGQFATFIENYNAVWRAVDLSLATYAANAATDWDKEFTPPGSAKPVHLSDLAAMSFPAEIDPEFEQIGNASSRAFDQHLWLTMFSESHFAFVERDHQYMHGTRDRNPGTPYGFKDHYAKRYPHSYYPGSPTWTGGQWMASVYEVYGRGGWLNKDSCNYVFKDNPQGKISNREALWLKSSLWKILPHGSP